eukprot:760355-Hanusia_phi.AAC.2
MSVNACSSFLCFLDAPGYTSLLHTIEGGGNESFLPLPPLSSLLPELTSRAWRRGRGREERPWGSCDEAWWGRDVLYLRVRG